MAWRLAGASLRLSKPEPRCGIGLGTHTRYHCSTFYNAAVQLVPGCIDPHPISRAKPLEMGVTAEAYISAPTETDTRVRGRGMHGTARALPPLLVARATPETG